MIIGILIENKDLFFSGAIQQSLFIHQILDSCNFDVRFYCNDKEYVYFGQPYMKTIKVESINVETLKGLNLMIYLSAVLNEQDSLVLKNMNIKIVQILCGNNYMFNQEKLVFGSHKTLHSFNNSYIDEYWLLPMYTHAKSYIETHSRKPVKIMPYIWNTTFVDLWMKNNENIRYEVGSKLNVLICEPNVNVFKTSLVPLIISEKCVDIIDRVYCLCLKNKKENVEGIFGDYLKIIKNNKLELYERLKLYNVLLQLKSQNKCPFIVSHQMLNDLNFLHLELFYLGYPVIHNCERMKSCGYFYKDHNIDMGANALYNAFCEHINDYNKIEYKNNVKKLLFRFSPYNKDNKKEYLSTIFEMCGKVTIPLKIKEEIPKYLYVYYKHKDKYSDFLSVNNNYKIIEYNDLQINVFFLKEYSKLYSDIYRFIEDCDVKMSFFYLCIIYKFGGLCMDPNLKCLERLDVCLEYDDDALLCFSEKSFNLSFMMCRKGVQSIYLTIMKYIYLFKSKQKYCRDDWDLSNMFRLECDIYTNRQFVVKDSIKYKFLRRKENVYIYKSKEIFEEASDPVYIYEKDNIYIPKIVFQTKLSNSKNNTKRVDNIMKKYFEGWKIVNFESDKKCIEYFTYNKMKEYPNIIEKFNLLKGAHKSDIFRYYYLYINGGCYLDDDAIINTHISNIIKEYSSVYIESNFFKTFKHIFNGFICVRPRDNIIKKALDHIYSIDYSKVHNYQIFCKELYSIIKLNIQCNTRIYKETIFKSNNETESKVKDENQNIILTHYFQTKVI